MKAKVEFKKIDSNIILSIGMIVKNEEKVLGRCLESLKPLMAAIPSELIIADTGSTDSTVEIAKKYTDNVYYFEWINDFAAARNSTLDRARGQWYLFLDADEYFDDDIKEIVDFFSIPELRRKYKTLEIMMRSYLDEERTKFNDACLPRFQRIDDPDEEVRFIGKIHESIVIRNPVGYFSTIVHHTGYCFSSQRQNKKKKDRNLELMRKEYIENPEDLRLLCHLADSCCFEPEEYEKYVEEALKISRKKRKDFYANVTFVVAVSFYHSSKPEYALKLCREYYEITDNYEKKVSSVSITMFEAKILSSLARYEEAYDAYLKYFALYEKNKNDELDISDLSAHPIFGLARHEYLENVFHAALVLKELKRYDEAFALLDKFESSEINDEKFKEYLGTIREICKAKRDYSQLAKFHDKFLAVEDNDRKALSLYMMESSYYALPSEEERKNFARDVSEYGKKNLYSELMQLVLDQDENDEQFKERLSDLIARVDDWSEGYSEAVYLAIKYRLDISEAVDKMKCSTMREKLEKIGSSNDDFANCVLAYGMPESYTQSIKRFFWLTSLYEKASYYTYSISDKDKYQLIVGFTTLLGDYVLNIYNNELFNDDDIEILPPLHRFGYYMSKANEAKQSGDKIGYIHHMKTALVNCESMKEIVKFLMEMFKKENNM